MTQLALLLALSLIGLVASLGFGRYEVKRGVVTPTVRRAEGAIERASVAVLRLGAVRGLLAATVPALGLAIASVSWLSASANVPALGRAAFLVVAVLAGAASTLVQARLALALGARAGSSAASAVARGSARALRPLLRSSVAVAVFGEALGLLGVAAAFASLYAVRGGFAGGDHPELAYEVVKLLPAYALGAAVTALSLSRTGSVAASAARVGGGGASDARDPSLLATLVGQLVGELLPRVLLTYVCGLCGTIAVALLAVLVVAPSSGALGCLAFAILVRAFGSLASVCGVLAASVTDDEPPAVALLRAHVSALLVAFFGLAEALFWIQRPHLAPLLGAGALGAVSLACVGQAAWLPLRRAQGTREQPDARAGAAIVRGASDGFSKLLLLLAVPALGLALGEALLGHASLPPGMLLVAFAAGALALLPFSLALASLGWLVPHARGVAALARIEIEPRRRNGSLDDAAVWGGAAGAAQASIAVAASTLLGFAALSGPRALGGAFGPGVLAAALGVGLVLFFGGRAAQSAVTGSRLVAAEAERQARTSAAEDAPSYRACVEAALAAAGASSVIELLALLSAPFALAFAAHWSAPAVPAPFLEFGVAAVGAGLIFTLGARATRAELGEPRRRLRSHEPTQPAALTSGEAESFGELVGVTAASNVEALSLVLALTVLCLVPLLRA